MGVRAQESSSGYQSISELAGFASRFDAEPSVLFRVIRGSFCRQRLLRLS